MSHDISYSFPVQNGVPDDFIDEKGNHEDIHEFASKADIVVCCLSLNSETVRHLQSVMKVLFCMDFTMRRIMLDCLASMISIYENNHISNLIFQVGFVNRSFLSSMKKVWF